MNQRITLAAGVLTAGLGVALGAFGAHALKDMLVASGRTETYELAVRYQFYHAFALLITGLLMNQFQAKSIAYAALCFVFGIILFSGSLYVLCFTGVRALGAVTPIGGVLFIAGWVLLLVGINKK
ncbi:MAG: DUF423 domain-containing protein [Bacteroidota bacterium]